MTKLKTVRFPSAVGAVLAAAIMTLASAVPEAVHAQTGCSVEPAAYTTSLQ